MLVKIIWLIVLIGLVPIILGMPWTKSLRSKHRYASAYGVGFFVALALFEVISFLITITNGSFFSIVIIYSIVLVAWCLISARYAKKNGLFVKPKIERLNWTEWIYLIAIAFIIGVQVFRGFSYELTYMSYDDATYLDMASDALVGNGLYNIYPHTGIAGPLITKYALTGWNIYSAYFAFVTGISVVEIAHTFQYIQMICLAYLVSWYLAGEVIKKRENQLIFMVIITLFYWFGYHSHYSLTFRLLGPNYQGKAVLAVSLTPLLLTIMKANIGENYSVRHGVLLLQLSLSGISLTLWGTGTIVVLVVIPVLLSLIRKERNWRHMLYILWSGMVPLVGFAYYLVNKFAI